MNLVDKFKAAVSIAQVKFSGKQIPVFLSWPITHRCNYACLYCGRPDQSGVELPTKRALEIVDEFAELGTQFVFLSGGEPLVRSDLSEIISRFRQHRVFVCLTTNGSLYLARKKEIGRVNMLKLSLDGPEEIHDSFRAKGSFAEVKAVLEDAQKDGIQVMLNPVISTATLPHLETLLSIAEEYQATVKFQPINYLPAGTKDISPLIPNHEQFIEMSQKLQMLKKRTRTVANTHAGISYLSTLPEGGPLKCYAGRLFAYLMPNGNLFPCNKREELTTPQSCADQPAAKALEQLSSVSCRTCWCTSDVELNLMMTLNPQDVFDVLRRVISKGF